ncbi:hypothetical protein [Streptomyces graminilatus]|uniref:hypothetical protein n=1 Tax=Streptomyces graminilatus TaxID=1464070 RepID=UPI0006E270FE|nr:hypothetical protein [Streptomyces graminilatus]
MRLLDSDRALRALLWLLVLACVPLYLYFLHHMAGRWADQLPADDATRPLLPVAIPLAALSFTLMSALSWWVTLAEGRHFLLGRTKWRFLMVFVVTLSVLTGIIGAPTRDTATVLLSLMLTFMGTTGLWFLPPAFSPRLLLPALARRKSAAQNSSL